jgi:S1-C subfamily serine protease
MNRICTARGAALALWAVFALAGPAAATEIEDRSRALQRAREAVLGVHVQAVEDARSAEMLGHERQGSGVVIAADGLVLTIGYLVLEAQVVELSNDDGRRFPARVVAYDAATGFGLVQALVPLGIAPVTLGDAGPGRSEAPLTVVSGGEDGNVGPARLVGRRAFSGFWEYHIEGALFTAPPVPAHSGAALFNPRGELLGIGSLAVPDALGPGRAQLAGNLFVPVDLIKPVLAELRQRGSTQASVRPWLGVNCIERGGQVRVAGVADDSPAEVAGLLPGDRILRVDGTRVAALAQLWKALWADSRAERAVELDIEREGQLMRVTVQAVDRAKTWRRAEGI